MDETAKQLRRSTNVAEHWVYHPVLDGHNTPPPDPLVEKARHLRQQGCTIITDAVRQEGVGLVHRLEWTEDGRGATDHA